MSRQLGSILVLTAGAFACAAPSVPTGPDPVKSTLTVDGPVVADGTSVARLVVTARDPEGLPIPGVRVVLSSTSSGIVLRQPLGATDGDGVATGGATSTIHGEALVRATADGVELKAGVGVRFLAPCLAGEVRCGEACVDVSSDPAHCGACDAACPAGPEEAATCVGGACGLDCGSGAGDCDGLPENGCEADLAAPETCGGCARECTANVEAHAAPTCEEPALAKCGFSCLDGWGSCDFRLDNGCEQPLDDDLHCGACQRSCLALSFPHGTGRCTAGRTCGVACDATFGNCDGRDETGCETDLTSASDCGECGRVCPGAQNATARCLEDASCGLACQTGWGDCANGDADGCETNLATSAANCGGCGQACAPRENAAPACLGGGCRYTCVAGFSDCNGDLSDALGDGCETDLSSGRCECQVSPTFATSSCLTVGSGARTYVGVRLRDLQGNGIVGAEVSIDAPELQWQGPVVQQEPGFYLREAVAGAAPGQATVRLVATAEGCGGVARLRSVPVTLAAPAVAGPEGGAGGCSPVAGHVRVKVVAAENGLPVPDALVMVGDAPGRLGLQLSYPRQNGQLDGPNVLFTDASGIVEFHDFGTALAGNQLVTAGAEGRAYATLAGVGASDVVLALPSITVPRRVRLSGSVTGTGYPQNNNGYLELALVTPTLDMAFVSSFNILRLLSDDHRINASGLLCGNRQYVVAGNIQVPEQTEAGSCRITGGETWGVDTAAGLKTDLLALHARMPVATLLGAGGASITQLLAGMEVRQIGRLPDQSTTGDASGIVMPLTHDLAPTMPVSVTGAPLGTLYAMALGDLDGGNGAGRLYLQSFRTVENATSLSGTLETNDPGGSFAGKTDFAGAISVSEVATTLVMDRTLLDRTSPRALTGFYAFPGGVVADRTFSWADVAGTTPAPQIARSELRRVTKVGAYGEEYEPFWIVWTPGDVRLPDGRRGFTLPTLPTDAPRGTTGGYLPASSLRTNEWFLALRHLGLDPNAAGFRLGRHAFGTETSHVTRVATDRVPLP